MMCSKVSNNNRRRSLQTFEFQYLERKEMQDPRFFSLQILKSNVASRVALVQGAQA